MSKSTKIIIAAAISVLVVCGIIIGVVTIVKSNKNGTGTVDENGNVVIDVSGSTTAVASVDNGTGTTAATTVADSASTDTSSTTSADSQSLETAILGKWKDSSGMMGFTFYQGGTVDITYVNLEVINIPIDGTATGTYTLEGDTLTVNFSIYTGNITKTYKAKVENNSLTLVDQKNNNTSVLMRQNESSTEETSTSTAESTTETTVASIENKNSIIGSWKSSDNTVQYTFFENGQLGVKFFGNGTSSDATGVYLLDEEKSKITIQYTSLGNTVTGDYTYQISGSSMSLKNDNDETTLFVKTTGESSSLIGKWKDSAGISGYEFKENNVVDVTLVDITIPVINMPINGTYTGSYTVEGDTVKISYSIYSNEISETYYYKVSGDTLVLTNVSDGTESTYVK